MKRKRRISVAAALSCLVVASAQAQPQNGKPFSGDPSTLPGVVRPLQDLTPGLNVGIGPNRMATPAELRAMRAQLLAVVEVLKPTPYFAKPVGFSSMPRIGWHSPSSAWRGSRLWPLPGRAEVTSFLNFIDRSGNLRIAAGPLRGDDQDSQGVRISVNDPGCLFKGQDPIFTDSAGAVFPKPGDEGSAQYGFPKFEHCVIVTQRKEPLFVPVSRERVLRDMIKNAAEALKVADDVMRAVPAAQRKDYETMVAERRGALERFRGMLAALSPAERAAPAVINFNAETVFASGGDAMQVPLVEVNPKFFDLTRLDQIQVISVLIGLSEEEVQFLPQVDWKGLLALAR